MFEKSQAERIEEERQEAARDDFARKEERIGKLSVLMSSIMPDPAQPRTVFPQQAIADLADNMACVGQLQPIRIRQDAALGCDVILDGHRRWLAKKKLGHQYIDAVYEEIERDAAEIGLAQLSANHFREEMTPGDVARKLRDLKEAGWTPAQLAAAGWKGSRVTQAMSYLGLEPAIQSMIDRGLIVKSAIYAISLYPTAEERLRVAIDLAEGMTTKDKAVADSKAARNGGRPYKRRESKKTAAVAEAATTQPEMVEVPHKTGIVFPLDPKQPFKHYKSAANSLAALLGKCNSYEELRAKLNQPKGEAAPKPASDGDATVEPDAEPEEGA